MSQPTDMGPTPRRGRPPSLTSGDVVEAALRVADAEGLDAVSMRRVAAELGVAVTTIYNHIESKDDLVDQMRDRTLAAFDVRPADDVAWPEQIFTALVALHRTFLAHPSGIELVFTSPAILKPRTRRIADSLVEILTTGGFTQRAAVDALNTLQVYVSGMANHRHVQDRRAAELRREVAAGADPQSPEVQHGRLWAAQIPDDTFRTGLRHLIEAMETQYAADTDP